MAYISFRLQCANLRRGRLPLSNCWLTSSNENIARATNSIFLNIWLNAANETIQTFLSNFYEPK